MWRQVLALERKPPVALAGANLLVVAYGIGAALIRGTRIGSPDLLFIGVCVAASIAAVLLLRPSY